MWRPCSLARKDALKLLKASLMLRAHGCRKDHMAVRESPDFSEDFRVVDLF
jgi:hypothetical protein